MPVVEFIVEGVPISAQTSNKTLLQQWKALVQAEAQKVWTQPPMPGNLRCTVMHFFGGNKPPCDDDNMVKPIRDALETIVFHDDSQITHSTTVQISNNDYFQIKGASKLVVYALQEEKEFVYIKIEDAPAHTQLPK